MNIVYSQSSHPFLLCIYNLKYPLKNNTFSYFSQPDRIEKLQEYYIYKLYRGCCKTKINMQCYESEKLAEHEIDSDFDHTNEAVPALYL